MEPHSPEVLEVVKQDIQQGYGFIDEKNYYLKSVCSYILNLFDPII